MNAKKVATYGNVLNIIIIITTIVMFIVFNTIGRTVSSVDFQTLARIANIQIIALWIYRIVAVICFVLALILFSKGKNLVKGLNLLVASAAVSLVFSILGLMLGIIIWILSGISMKQLKQTVAEDDFKAKLGDVNDTL